MNQSYNNVFDGFQQPVVQTQNGGVRGNKGGAKTLKKWIIIAVVLIILLSVVVIAFVNMPNINPSKTSLKDEYLNLLVFGKNSSDPFTREITKSELISSSSKNVYYFPIEEPLAEETVNYFNQLKQSLEKIKNTANVGGTYSDEEKNNVVFLVADSEILISYYFVGAILTRTDAAYEYYISNDSFDDFLNRYDYPFQETEDEMLESASKAIEDLYNNRKSFYDAAKDGDCIKTDYLDYDCLDSANSSSIEELEFEKMKLYPVVEIHLNNILKRLVADTNSIASIMKGTGNE